MGKYGNAAIKATKLMRSGRGVDPQEAWNIAVTEVFPTQMASRKKGCPRGAYLGLCEEGLVHGVKPGHYTTSKKNKGYALEALKTLTENPSIVNDHRLLWKKVMKGAEKVENNQMDVVTSLFQRGYLVNL